MAAKAIVPAEAFPCIHRFRGHGPLLQRHCPRLVCVAHPPSPTEAPLQYDFGSPSTFSAM